LFVVCGGGLGGWGGGGGVVPISTKGCAGRHEDSVLDGAS